MTTRSKQPARTAGDLLFPCALRKTKDFTFDPLKVDLVAEAADRVTELIVVQSSPWTGSDAQIRSLQDKVHTYVSFPLDGEMARRFPESVGRPWRIVINSLSGAPDARTQSVLDMLAVRLPRHGGSLLVRVN
ncbi:DUF6572 domain-containing protein [Aquipuribacter nitratireducens]|uniref:DUF6572 domain-containing protein n=1 Tax=Aquipuribacter nitratireducens TaxID=650104 RepID=A0ABW0GJ21_9MICO